MANADEIQNDVSGVNDGGDPLDYRLVKARHHRDIGDVVNDDDRGEWNSSHNDTDYKGTFDAFEQIVCVAEQLAWRHKFSDGVTRDPGDILIALGEYLVARDAFDDESE